ncbi:hypothetical protein ACFQZC_27070 [Streptacidiphilus monticola]
MAVMMPEAVDPAPGTPDRGPVIDGVSGVAGEPGAHCIPAQPGDPIAEGLAEEVPGPGTSAALAACSGRSSRMRAGSTPSSRSPGTGAG